MVDNNVEVIDIQVKEVLQHGKFSIGSACRELRQERPSNHLDNRIWHSKIPFKMSFLTWRAIHNRLSIDKSVARLGIPLEPNYYCCNSNKVTSELESVDHIFCHGDLAKRLWSYFAGPLGINNNNTNLKLRLLNYWNHRTKNPFCVLIIKIIPAIICWEIWRSRCCKKFEEVGYSTYRLISNVLFFILQALKNKFASASFGNTWSTICQACEASIQQKVTIQVKWIKPQLESVKLNSDGSCLNREYGGGGTVRDPTRRVIFAYAIPLGKGTSNMEKEAAMLFGLVWCSRNGNTIVWGETDSLLLTKCINREWKPPWNIANYIESIQKPVEENEFIITHCYREANKPADKLAAISHASDVIQIFNSFSEISTSVRGLINMDRWNPPSFRIKEIKDRNLVYDHP
ncbi:uncharacterized protein LOC132057945 [Lycium ferocissimum]|uniref:uncharacterized protein LOC132057945 n=1 Tax=Lycium ferocissimum TaxID=112874 RepID=UPI0028158931|nr:uncharacterized protein LOC132057945 [Lycium ferocissimum]